MLPVINNVTYKTFLHLRRMQECAFTLQDWLSPATRLCRLLKHSTHEVGPYNLKDFATKIKYDSTSELNHPFSQQKTKKELNHPFTSFYLLLTTFANQANHEGNPQNRIIEVCYQLSSASFLLLLLSFNYQRFN